MGKKTLFPLEAKFNRVLGIIDLLIEHDGVLSLSKLTHLSGEHVDILLPQIDASKMLKLVRVEKDNVHLLALGKKLYEGDAAAFGSVSSLLSKIEPFSTAVHLSNAKGSFDIDELLDELLANGISF
jgi:hypothetical protein